MDLSQRIEAAKARKQEAAKQLRQTRQDFRQAMAEVNAERDRKLAEANEKYQKSRRRIAEERAASKPNPAAKPAPVTFGKIMLDGGHIQRGLFDRRPIAGVTAEIGDLERSKTRKGLTAARILAGSISAAADAINRIGAKQLTISGPGFHWTVEVPSHRLERAREFAALVNAAAAQQH